MKQLQKQSKTKAWIGAAINAATSIAGIVAKIIQQNKQNELQEQQIANENNRRWNTELNNAYANQSDIINEYNDKLVYKCGGVKKRKKCGDGALATELFNGSGSILGSITSSLIASNADIYSPKKINLVGTANDVITRKKIEERNNFQLPNNLITNNNIISTNQGSPIGFGNPSYSDRLRMGKYGLIHKINN